MNAKPVRRRNNTRGSRDEPRDNPAIRLNISMPSIEHGVLVKIASDENVSLSKLLTDSTLQFKMTARLGVSLKVISLEDLEFMTSIVKTVGVPLALEELLSLLQKHKSKEE